MTLHRATLNGGTVKRRQYTGRQLTAATDNRATLHRASSHPRRAVAPRAAVTVPVSPPTISYHIASMDTGVWFEWEYYYHSWIRRIKY